MMQEEKKAAPSQDALAQKLLDWMSAGCELCDPCVEKSFSDYVSAVQRAFVQGTLTCKSSSGDGLLHGLLAMVDSKRTRAKTAQNLDDAASHVRLIHKMLGQMLEQSEEAAQTGDLSKAQQLLELTISKGDAYTPSFSMFSLMELWDEHPSIPADIDARVALCDLILDLFHFKYEGGKFNKSQPGLEARLKRLLSQQAPASPVLTTSNGLSDIGTFYMGAIPKGEKYDQMRSGLKDLLTPYVELKEGSAEAHPSSTATSVRDHISGSGHGGPGVRRRLFSPLTPGGGASAVNSLPLGSVTAMVPVTPQAAPSPTACYIASPVKRRPAVKPSSAFEYGLGSAFLLCGVSVLAVGLTSLSLDGMALWAVSSVGAVLSLAGIFLFAVGVNGARRHHGVLPAGTGTLTPYSPKPPTAHNLQAAPCQSRPTTLKCDNLGDDTDPRQAPVGR